MNKKLLSILKYLVFLGIAFGLLYFSFKGIDLDQVLASIKRANFTWIIVAMIAGYLAFVFRGLRWKLLLEPMGYEVNAWDGIHSVNIGYLANLAVPRLGEVTRCTVMNRSGKIPVDKLFGTVIAERVIDLVMLGGCFLLTFILKFEDLERFIQQAQSTQSAEPTPWLMYLLFMVLAALVVAGLIWKFWAQVLRIPFVPKVVAFLQGILSGLLAIGRLKHRGRFILYTLLIWVLYFLMSYLYFFCLPETANLTPGDGLFIMIVGSLGIIAPAPGGIGAFHATVILGLVTLGIDKTLAGTMAIIVHTSQSLMTVISGLLALFLLSLGRKKSGDAVLQ